MEKRFILAIALVFIILFLWPLLFGRRRPSPAPPPQKMPREVQKEEPEAEPPKREVLPQVSEETIISVQTPIYEVLLTTEGARAVSWKLKEYFKRGKEPKSLFRIDDPNLQSDLDNNNISEELKQRFKENRVPISDDVTVEMEEKGSRWLISDEQMYTVYSVRKEEGKFNIYEPEYMDMIPLTAEKCLAMQFHDPELQGEMEDAQWTPDRGSLIVEDVEGAQDSIEFLYTTSTGIEIFKKMTFFRDSYFVDVDIGFRNPSSEEARLGRYDLCWGPGISKDEIIADMEVAKEGPMVLLRTEKSLMRHWKSPGFPASCAGGKSVLLSEQGGPISWVAFASKYFATVLIPGPDSWWSDPEKGEKRYAVATDAKDTVLPPALPLKDVWKEWGASTTVALVRPESPIAAGETVLHEFRVYVGPKKWDILRGIQSRDGSTEGLGLSKMISFGMFSPLGKATLWLLKVFYRVGGNYGIAIILLTILIKLLYLPLTQKSFKSMRKMQELQPKISDLREKYRDDPQRLNKETMKMYKQHGASPLGGCLPMLFQIPVFWALFATLRGAVEIRGAMFIPGWVTDLSLPDTVAVIAGRFPLRILPLLMTGSMLVQQLIFGTGGGSGAGQSNKMMAFMPLIFAFIFYGMPSGLVLYWFCNNILAIGHQYLIRRQQSTKTEDQEEDEGKKTYRARKENRTRTR
jgi:YidC/Oxa1 family membrane protein insertase